MKTKLELIPDGIFSRHYSVFENGRCIAGIHLKMLSLSSKGQLTIGNNNYTVFRNGWLSGNGILQSPSGEVLAIALKKGLFSATYQVDYKGETVLLKKKSLRLKESWLVYDGENLRGSIVQNKFFSRRLTFETDMDIPLEIRVFIFWIIIVVISNNQSSDSSASSAQ